MKQIQFLSLTVGRTRRFHHRLHVTLDRLIQNRSRTSRIIWKKIFWPSGCSTLTFCSVGAEAQGPNRSSVPDRISVINECERFKKKIQIRRENTAFQTLLHRQCPGVPCITGGAALYSKDKSDTIRPAESIPHRIIIQSPWTNLTIHLVFLRYILQLH